MSARCRRNLAFFFAIGLKPNPRTKRRQGLTLLELLVVLIILAIMATIAVQSIQPRVENARFEATQKTLEHVQNAILGATDKRQTDGTPMIDGFFADIGRLPRLVEPTLPISVANPPNDIEKIPTTNLSELWDPQCRLAQEFPFQFRAGPVEPNDYSEIKLACGWRGPYLQLSIGATKIVDGWGNRFGTELDASMQVIKIMATPKVEALDVPLVVDLSAAKVSVTGTIVELGPTTGDIKVVLLAPNAERSLNELVVYDDEDDERLFFQFDAVPIGLRAVVVQVGTERIVRYIQVPHGGVTMTVPIGKVNSNINVDKPE